MTMTWSSLTSGLDCRHGEQKNYMYVGLSPHTGILLHDVVTVFTMLHTSGLSAVVVACTITIVINTLI